MIEVKNLCKTFGRKLAEYSNRSMRFRASTVLNNSVSSNHKAVAKGLVSRFSMK